MWRGRYAKAVKQSIPSEKQLVRPLRGRIARKKDGEKANHNKSSLKEDKGRGSEGKKDGSGTSGTKHCIMGGIKSGTEGIIVQDGMAGNVDLDRTAERRTRMEDSTGEVV